jgi:hypothetical protein
VSCSGGRCSKSLAALGFLRSRLEPSASRSAAGTFQARSFSSPLVPPFEAAGEFLELDRLSLRVVLPTFGKRLLVVPDFFGWMRSIKEHEIRWDTGVRGEDTVGKADDGMEIELIEQFLFDAGADAIAEECAVRDDHSGAAGVRWAFELAHDELEKKQCRFRALFILREITQDAALFFAAEGWVGHDDIDTVSVADFPQWETEAV